MIHHHWYEFIIQQKEEEVRRHLKQRQLLQAAGFRSSNNWILPRKLAGWLGVQMVRWGSKLQSYHTISMPSPELWLGDHQTNNDSDLRLGS